MRETTEQSGPYGVTSIHRDALNRCAEGDRHAQMQIYHLYYKAMYNTAYRIVLDRHDAEDVMQNAFLTAFLRLKELDNLALFPAWLKRIVVNESINQLRSKRNYEHHKEAWEDQDEEDVNVDASPFTVEQIRQAILDLPQGYRMVVSLYLLEGYDHEEISEILGISSATSRSQYNRGKKKLKEQLMAMQ